MPASVLDTPNAGLEVGGAQRSAEARSLAMLERVRAVALPRLVREAEDRGWWAPRLTWAGRTIIEGSGPGLRSEVPAAAPAAEANGTPTTRPVTAADLDRLRLASRVVSPFDPVDALALLRAALLDNARVVAAVVGEDIVGLAVVAPSATEPAVESLLAVGVAPTYRGAGLGRALLAALVVGCPTRTAIEARVGVAERDVADPVDVRARLDAARRLLVGAGFRLQLASPDLARDDPQILVARLPGR
jgi:GNAT superfamily N-acetyltransferase